KRDAEPGGKQLPDGRLPGAGDTDDDVAHGASMRSRRMTCRRSRAVSLAPRVSWWILDGNRALLGVRVPFLAALASPCLCLLALGCGDSGAMSMPACGDGVVDVGEACDDGNTIAGDGCSAACTPEYAVSVSVTGAGSGQVTSDVGGLSCTKA